MKITSDILNGKPPEIRAVIFYLKFAESFFFPLICFFGDFANVFRLRRLEVWGGFILLRPIACAWGYGEISLDYLGLRRDILRGSSSFAP